MRNAIVCGSGVAGLSAAIALAQSGWSVEVFERADAVREIGAGIFIKANSLRVLDSFAILDRIRRDCVVLREARTLDRTGRLLQRRALHQGNPVWNIQRQPLIRALLDRAIELGVRVSTGHAVEAVGHEGSVRIEGVNRGADLVVAADGVSSIVRRSLGLDRPVQLSRSGAIRLLISRGEHESEEVVRESWSGHLRVGICPCSSTEAFVYLIAPLEDAAGSRLPLDADYWSAHFPQLAAEGVFARARRSTAAHHRYPVVRTASWVRGRIALVGDAAHALPPTLGQGAGLSLTNASLLAHYVTAIQDVDQGLATWERDWRWISDRTQVWSRRYDRLTSEWPAWAYLLRDGIIWGLGKSRSFNGYMRIADRVDAPRRRVLTPAEIAVGLYGPRHLGASNKI